MKHHFGDLLDRDGDYWTIVPNVERYAYRIGDIEANDADITIVTIGKEDAAWKTVLTLPNLVELTLHSPSREQLESVAELTGLERLRITHARPKAIDFLESLPELRELVLEYVSGFSDLSPVGSLPRLKSLHLENLRKVRDFGGLAGSKQLRYLRIDGTLDWKQPIDDFEFLRELPALEVLAFGQIISKAAYPAMLSVSSLPHLKRLQLAPNMLAAEEYALLEVSLKEVEGANWGPYRRMEYAADDEWFEFTGKGAGRAKCGHEKADQKCSDYAKQYDQMKENARSIVSKS